MLLSATLVAEGSLVAITAYVFAQVTAGGVVLNFVAVPLMAVVQVAGLGVVACGLLHPALAWPPAYVAAWAARGILDSARVVDLVPWAAPQVVPPPLWLAATMTVSWWAAWWLPHRAARRACAALWLAGLAAILAGVPLASSGRAHLVPWRHPPCGVPETPRVYAPHGWLRVVFLDVGQGGATSVQFPDGTAALVDAGGSAAASRFDVGARIVLPALRALGVRRLSTLVLTHGDLDHVGGAPAVLDGFRPLEVWEGIPVSTHVPMRELASRASMLGVPWMQVRSGGTRVRGPVTLRVWHPPEPDWERRRVRNDDSVVIEMRFGDVSVLLPGDIGADVEAILARRIPRAPIRVIEAAHHGSGGSTSTAWLDALDPAAAVVSAGRDNRHGHPSPAVLERLRERRIAVFRSDRDGAVLLDTNGVGVWMTTCAEASSGSGAPSRAAQTRWAPGRPDSMQKEAAVETGAPGVVTNGTTR
jgi:competence protein ComEC